VLSAEDLANDTINLQTGYFFKYTKESLVDALSLPSMNISLSIEAMNHTCEETTDSS